MRKELIENLNKKYPDIFRDLYGDPTKTCMAFEIETGDGWYDLLDELCSNIQHYIWPHGNPPPSDYEWASKEPKCEQVVAAQIKEKFGTLRFYYDGGDEYIRGLVDMAESMSGHICENCGNKGETNGKGWLRTECEPCMQDRMAKR